MLCKKRKLTHTHLNKKSLNSPSQKIKSVLTHTAQTKVKKYLTHPHTHVTKRNLTHTYTKSCHTPTQQKQNKTTFYHPHTDVNQKEVSHINIMQKRKLTHTFKQKHI